MVYRDGHVDPAATLGAALLRSALLFAAATLAYRALQDRFIHGSHMKGYAGLSFGAIEGIFPPVD